MNHQLDIFDNGSASQVGERQTDLEDLIAEINATLKKEKPMFDVFKAAEASKPELLEAVRRIENGEPFSTTAEEIGLMPHEMQEMFEALGLMNPP